VFPSDVRDDVNREETKSHGAILQRRLHDFSISHSDAVPACDRQSDGQTDIRIYYSYYSYAEAL